LWNHKALESGASIAAAANEVQNPRKENGK
jgi:hypothetical protein